MPDSPRDMELPILEEVGHALHAAALANERRAGVWAARCVGRRPRPRVRARRSDSRSHPRGHSPGFATVAAVLVMAVGGGALAAGALVTARHHDADDQLMNVRYGAANDSQNAL